jgi:hypothetical protein
MNRQCRKKVNSGILILSFVVALLVNSIATADSLETKDGKLIQGTYMGGTQNSVRFQVGSQLETFPVSEILAITFTGPPSTAQPAEPAAVPPPPPPPQRTAAPAIPTASPDIRSPVTIPAGTRLMVRMDSTLDSKRHGVGHMFTTTLENNLVAGGKSLATKGAKLYGRLTQAKQAGRLAGKSELSLQLTDVMINGVPHPIVASGVKAVGEGSGGKTVRNVAVGTGIGALVRGSKGAKRGAAVGLGASVLTSGSEVRIPAGTVLEFRLASDFTFVP